MILCAGEIENINHAVPIGIGMVASAIKLSRICSLKTPKELVFLGTAGSYGNAKIGEFLQSHETENVELAYLDNFCYTPIKSNVSRETSKGIIVNSSNYITTNPRLATLMHEKFGFELENMEFFAVKMVAKSFNIPFRGYFFVTNYCNENAHEDFLKNHKNALKILNAKADELQKELS